MRIDYGRGDHLRFGSLLIARARQPEGAPFLDGGSTVLVRVDEPKVLAVAEAASLLCATATGSATLTQEDDDGHGAKVWMVPDSALRRLQAAVVDHDLAVQREHFGSLVFTHAGRSMALGWLGATTPMPARWRPRFLLARVRWIMAGRPANVRTLGGTAWSLPDGVTSIQVDVTGGGGGSGVPSARGAEAMLDRADPYGDGTPHA